MLSAPPAAAKGLIHLLRNLILPRVFAGFERKVAEEKRAWRICFNRFKPEIHGRCSHCGAEGGPGTDAV